MVGPPNGLINGDTKWLENTTLEAEGCTFKSLTSIYDTKGWVAWRCDILPERFSTYCTTTELQDTTSNENI